MLGGVTGKTSMDAFLRIEETVEALEEAMAEMGSQEGNFLPGTAGSSVEAQFRRALEASNSVDDELNKLKGLLGPSRSRSRKPSPTPVYGRMYRSTTQQSVNYDDC